MVRLDQGHTWQKSSFSGGGDGANCVELSTTQNTVRLRESDAPSLELKTTTARLATLIAAVKTGRFDESAARP
ncbi:DUF397 domain-containing protein [Streptomyces sp. MZ04]|uniref:DUF397 domain-containing protein n=1 Tax=Streptomyces sp. MZ04 TaxID=2559236 RepID=UPI001ADEEC57|nr:DUF397 domain-containing protein [Streptomyces sp. MZ04]